MHKIDLGTRWKPLSDKTPNLYSSGIHPSQYVNWKYGYGYATRTEVFKTQLYQGEEVTVVGCHKETVDVLLNELLQPKYELVMDSSSTTGTIPPIGEKVTQNVRQLHMYTVNIQYFLENMQLVV